MLCGSFGGCWYDGIKSTARGHGSANSPQEGVLRIAETIRVWAGKSHSLPSLVFHHESMKIVYIVEVREDDSSAPDGCF